MVNFLRISIIAFIVVNLPVSASGTTDGGYTGFEKSALPVGAVSAEEETPVLSFEDTEKDFGIIGEKDGKVHREFVFTNRGNCPLIITRVITSCRCIDAEFPKKPVLPGQSGKITVTYNPRKQRGIFYKAIQVYSNDPKRRHIIAVKGEVESDVGPDD